MIEPDDAGTIWYYDTAASRVTFGSGARVAAGDERFDSDRYEAGRHARRDGHPISVCPFPPGDPAGHDWRIGWIGEEGRRRYHAGTYGAAPEEKEAAVALCRAGPDPTMILDEPGPDDVPARLPVTVRDDAGFTPAELHVNRLLTDSIDRLEAALADARREFDR